MSPVEDTRDKLKVLISPSIFLDYQSENCSKFFVEYCENITLIQINLRNGCVIFVLVRILKVPGIQISVL